MIAPRLFALLGMLGSLLLVVGIFLMKYHLPHVEASWEKSRVELSSGAALLLKVGHLARPFFWFLLAGAVALGGCSARWYRQLVQQQRRVTNA